jgi:hypothetical protein
MQGVARLFFTLAVIYAVVAMILGLHMGMSGNHLEMPTHAHLLLAGWVSSAIFAFFYLHYPELNFSPVARVHFWVQTTSTFVMVGALFILFAGESGNSSAEPLVGIGSVGYLAGMLLFAWIALGRIWRTEPIRA